MSELPPSEIPLKAYEDVEFLKRDEMRAVRLQTELLKPQILMDDAKVHSTVVIFGSARTKPPEEVAPRLQAAELRAREHPHDPSALDELRLALAPGITSSSA